MDLTRWCAALVLVCAGCSDDTGTEPADSTGGTAAATSDTTAADGGPGGMETTGDAADSSSGGDTGTETGIVDSSSGDTADGTSTGSAVDCDLLAPISDPPDPGPPTGACGYALPMPNEDCGAQPVPGSLVCAATLEAFDPMSGELPEMTDWRCAQASSGGYCIELQGGLYSFCSMPVTTLEEFAAECVQCLIEIPKDGVIDVSWEEGPVWDVPECATMGGGSTGG